MFVTSVTSSPHDLLRDRLARFTKTLDGVEQGDVRALHRARVGARRLRELVPVLQLESLDARKLTRRLRKVTERLGEVRELDVLRLLVDELQTARPAHAPALRRIREAVDADAVLARARLFERLPIDELWRVADRLERAADASSARKSGGAAERAWRWAVDARIARRAARLVAAINDAGPMYMPERLHDVRIALKKLRYAAELGRGHLGRALPPALAALKREQGLLGRMHDLQVLLDRARRHQGKAAPQTPAASREMDALVAWIEDECRRLHARYVRGRGALIARAETLDGRVADQAPVRAARRVRRAG